MGDDMSASELSRMDLKEDTSGENVENMGHDLWPLDPVDPTRSRFPCCLVWTPLPVVSWLAPFIGHVGICREDGAILDFSGSNMVTTDDFAFGSVARYVHLDRTQCCLPPTFAGHTCAQRYKHADYGTAISWDDALRSTTSYFEHKSFNLFTCNCHSLVANFLNRVCYGGSMNWNMVNVAALVLCRGSWVDGLSVLRSFSPFVAMLCLGVYVVGWPFLVGLLSFSLLLLLWFVVCNYLFKSALDC